jgi:hypothetical protein
MERRLIIQNYNLRVTHPAPRLRCQPVLNRLHRAMELTRRKTLPQGLLGQAIDYALKRWAVLNQFIADGTLEIDNNLIENAIRPSALGKKNFLFFGHPEAGERSAVIYTLLGSCRRQGINPFDYLKDLFTRLPAAKITQIKAFTPAAWAKATRTHQTNLCNRAARPPRPVLRYGANSGSGRLQVSDSC